MYCVSLIAAQALAAYVAFRMAMGFWLLRLRRDHIVRLRAYECISLLQVRPAACSSLHACIRLLQIPVSGGFLAECIATAVNRTFVLFTLERCPRALPFVSSLLWSLLVTVG